MLYSNFQYTVPYFSLLQLSVLLFFLMFMVPCILVIIVFIKIPTRCNLFCLFGLKNKPNKQNKLHLGIFIKTIILFYCSMYTLNKGFFILSGRYLSYYFMTSGFCSSHFVIGFNITWILLVSMLDLHVSTPNGSKLNSTLA